MESLKALPATNVWNGPLPDTIAVDPGRDTGWAFWKERTLIGCGLGTPDFKTGTPCLVIIERPQIYPNQPVPPNDLITLAIMVGRYAALAEEADHEVKTVLPHEWKGNLPKEISHARTLKALRAEELAVVQQADQSVAKGKRHNMLDAVGIGVYFLGT